MRAGRLDNRNTGLVLIYLVMQSPVWSLYVRPITTIIAGNLSGDTGIFYKQLCVR